MSLILWGSGVVTGVFIGMTIQLRLSRRIFDQFDATAKKTVNGQLHYAEFYALWNKCLDCVYKFKVQK